MATRSWRRFNIRSLFFIVFTAAVFFAGYRLGFHAGRDALFHDLIELITTTISPDTWEDIGGPAAVHAAEGANCFLLTPASSESDDPFATVSATQTRATIDPFE